MLNVMVDIETLGKGERAAVASIGACAFDPTRVETLDELLSPTRTFEVSIDLRSTPDRVIDADTVYWWLRQDRVAQTRLSFNQVRGAEAAERFLEWTRRRISHDDAGIRVTDYTVWCYGATFDHPILASFLGDYNLKYPWSYRHQLCARTVASLAPDVAPVASDELVAHSAMHDAVRQAEWLQRCLRRLRELKSAHLEVNP
jgi:hypothetical protein